MEGEESEKHFDKQNFSVQSLTNPGEAKLADKTCSLLFRFKISCTLSIKNKDWRGWGLKILFYNFTTFVLPSLSEKIVRVRTVNCEKDSLQILLLSCSKWTIFFYINEVTQIQTRQGPNQTEVRYKMQNMLHVHFSQAQKGDVWRNENSF